MAGERDGRIRFYCEHCREAVSAPGDKAGKKGQCPKCDRLMAIPAQSTRQPGERHPEQGRPFPRPHPKVDDTREPIRFFTLPGGTVQDSFVTNQDLVAMGDIFFRSPDGRPWPAGEYLLRISHPKASAGLPIELQ